MGRIGLFASLILFPVFVHATGSPTLTTYTLSHNAVYPTATAASGLATTTSIDIAFSEQVKVSIKIMSALGALVKSLYTSSGVTNPTPKIWDGTNNAGSQADMGTYTILISATSTATGLAMTDSSKTITIATEDDSSSGSSSDATDVATDTTTTSSDSGPPEYIPIPILRILTGGNRTVSSSADVAFTAVVYDGKGNKRNDAVVTWSFGDGMRKTGASVFHAYYSSGEYPAVVRATTADGGDASQEIVVTVKNAGIRIAAISSSGITLANDDSRTLDISFWRLSMGGKEFKFPEDTRLLANHTVLFPAQVIELPLAGSASLLYPSGEVAAVYPTRATVQPSHSAASYDSVQAVEPITSTKPNIQAHDEGIRAPVAANELAATGAVAPSGPTTSSSRGAGIFSSPWTLGFLGIVALAGSAFIFL